VVVNEAESARESEVFLVWPCSGTDALVQRESLVLPSVLGAGRANASEGCSKGFSRVLADAKDVGETIKDTKHE
jgi:hypothetical protein